MGKIALPDQYGMGKEDYKSYTQERDEDVR